MTMFPPVLPVKKTPPPRTARSFVPALKWPSLNSSYVRVDLTRFPSLHEENYRYTIGEFGSWSEEFMSAFRSARDRVWLIDSFLLKINDEAKANFFEVFSSALGRTPAQPIRLLTSGKAGHQEQLIKLNQIQNARRAPPTNEGFTIEVKFIREGRTPVRLPHDRFAIIDDELWHWGANVGGTHHEVNAFSRGWPAHETGASDYFDRLWSDAERLS